MTSDHFEYEINYFVMCLFMLENKKHWKVCYID